MNGGEEQGSAFLCIRHKGETLVCVSARARVRTPHRWGLGVGGLLPAVMQLGEGKMRA